MGRSGPGQREPRAAGDALRPTRPLRSANLSAESLADHAYHIGMIIIASLPGSPPSILSSSCFRKFLPRVAGSYSNLVGCIAKHIKFGNRE